MKWRALALGLAIPPFAPAAGPPTFARDIAPIIYRSCAPCHRPGEAGPFPLLRYEDVKKHARQIALVTGRRFMPPWLPEPGHGDFADALRLSNDQIRTIAAWAAAGAPEGEATEIPPIPNFTEGWQLGPPDLILEAAQAHALPASGPDVYWNFIFTVPIPEARWVRAIEIRPGNKRTVHHANLYIDRAHSARREETTPGAGFAGMDVVIERTVFDPDDGHFLYWKPGSAPYSEPDDLAWRLDPGSDLVLNAHLQPTGKPEQVRPSIGLYFTDHPGTRFPMLIQLEHDGAIDIPAGVADFVISDDFRLPLDVDVLAVYPHAHLLGHLLEGYATLPNGERKWLVRIPAWDRNWEGVYRYRDPVSLPKGSVISMRFHYDNSAANARNPHHPPQRVRAGNTAADEMGHLWLQVLPTGSRDRRIELQEALMIHRLEKYPGDSGALVKLGSVRLARLNAPGAVVALQAAVRVQPKNPEAHNMLGSAFSALGRAAESIVQFRLALALRPEYENARYNLARALVRAGKLDEALDDYRKLEAAFPQDAQVHNALGELLLKQRKFAESVEEFDKAIAIDPSLESAKKNRDLALQSR